MLQRKMFPRASRAMRSLVSIFLIKLIITMKGVNLTRSLSKASGTGKQKLISYAPSTDMGMSVAERPARADVT